MSSSLFASVPDPLHSRLALFTDSSINAIGQAAFDSHWEFAAQWLPWYDNTDPSEKKPAERRKQRSDVHLQEKQPGILIFRHAPTNKTFDADLLIVFLAGETPTAGINGYQFRMARAFIRAFADPPDVRIAAPQFSGSFFSLAQLIEEEQPGARHAQPSGYRYWVRTVPPQAKKRRRHSRTL